MRLSNIQIFIPSFHHSFNQIADGTRIFDVLHILHINIIITSFEIESRLFYHNFPFDLEKKQIRVLKRRFPHPGEATKNKGNGLSRTFFGDVNKGMQIKNQ